MSAIIDSLIERYPALSGARQSIETLCQWLMETYANGNRLLVAGNGGAHCRRAVEVIQIS